jgi:hypothetical protein
MLLPFIGNAAAGKEKALPISRLPQSGFRSIVQILFLLSAAIGDGLKKRY